MSFIFNILNIFTSASCLHVNNKICHIETVRAASFVRKKKKGLMYLVVVLRRCNNKEKYFMLDKSSIFLGSVKTKNNVIQKGLECKRGFVAVE